MENRSQRPIDPELVRSTYWFLAVPLLFFVVVGSLYWYVVWRSGRLSPAEAGQVGDFFGGVFNPLLGLLSLVALVITVVLTRRSIDASRDALLAAERQFEERLGFDRRESRKADLFRMIEFLDTQLPTLSGRPITGRPLATIGSSPSYFQFAGTSTTTYYFPTAASFIDEAFELVGRQELDVEALHSLLRERKAFDTMFEVGAAVRQLVSFLQAYEVEGGDSLTLKYFQHRHFSLAYRLHTIGLLDSPTFGYFRDATMVHGSAELTLAPMTMSATGTVSAS